MLLTHNVVCKYADLLQFYFIAVCMGLIQIGMQVVADISAELAAKMPAALTDADAAAITFQVAQFF